MKEADATSAKLVRRSSSRLAAGLIFFLLAYLLAGFWQKCWAQNDLPSSTRESAPQSAPRPGVVAPGAVPAANAADDESSIGRPLTTEPPPKIPRPPAPPDDTRFSIDLKSPVDVPPAGATVSQDVKLGIVKPSKLPRLEGASGPLPPIRLEASFVEATTLPDVLSLALANNLPIRISNAEFKSSRYKVLSAVGNFLPNMATGYFKLRTYSGGSHTDAPSFYNVVYLPVFNGGEDLFRFLRTKHEAKAARFVQSSTTNDVLLDVYCKYQDLLLQNALLQVRVKGVDVSKVQLQQNEDRKAAGEGTIFEVMQSKTRLAQDRQLLLRQQVAFRQAALRLAVAINVSPAINLLPEETLLSQSLLVDPKLNVADLVKLAIERRPELKENEELRIAARRHIQEQLSTLYPDVKFFLATNVSSISGSGASSGTTNGGIVVPAGNALAGGLISTGGSAAGSNTAFTTGFALNWFVHGMGVVETGNSLALREQARKVTLKANYVLMHILEEVRSSYLEMLTNKEEIAVAYEGVESASEELRTADLRLKYSVGTNLELLSAQRDYFEALARQAESIVNYRKSQARLLRDTGTISITSLTTDLRPINIR